MEILNRHLIWSKFSTELIEKDFVFGEKNFEQSHLNDLYQTDKEAVLKLEQAIEDRIETNNESIQLNPFENRENSFISYEVCIIYVFIYFIEK